MLRECIEKVLAKRSLTAEEAEDAMDKIMEGKCSEIQIASFITALRMKKESVNEITGFARAMRKKSLYKKAEDMEFLDTCGTGGDGTNTFNVSTITSLVAAGAGLKVAKHGNRSISSKCGSADLLSMLGVKIELSAEEALQCAKEIGITFLFAPSFHKAMKHVANTRKTLGIRTIFNILGPLTNPFGAKYQLLGVYNPEIATIMAEVLGNLGTKHAFVVHSDDGMDEVSLCAETTAVEYKNSEVREFKLEPGDFGFDPCNISELKGGSPEVNAEIAKNILSGKDKTNPKRKHVLINSAMAVMAGNRANNIKEAMEIVRESLDSGAAMKKLENLIEFTNSVRA